MENSPTHRLGFGINVVVPGRLTDSNYPNEQSVPVADAFRSLSAFVDDHDAPNIDLFAPRSIERRLERWFGYWDFFPQTGVLPENVIYFGQPELETEVIAGRNLTAFIDHRISVVGQLSNVKQRIALRPDPREVATRSQGLGHPIITLASWEEVGRHLALAHR